MSNLSRDTLKSWLNGRYVSPKDFKKDLQKLIKDNEDWELAYKLSYTRNREANLRIGELIEENKRLRNKNNELIEEIEAIQNNNGKGK